MENNNKNVFETLSAINVSGKTEKKNGLTYLSWAYAWGELCKVYPTATYKVHERDTQWGPCNYFTDGCTAWVKVSVTIGDLTHTEMLPIMDYRNKSISLDKVTSCDANKAIQRCITKAVARFGLGLYVYAGEDLPSSVEYSDPIQAQPAQPVKPVEKATQPQMTAQAPVQKPVQKDTRPVTTQELEQLKKTLKEYGIDDEMFICDKYKIKSKNLGDLQMYQYHHILANINKLKQICDSEKQQRLADMVKNAKKAEAEMSVSFGDAIAPPQLKEDDGDGEPIDLASLGLSPADLEALSEAGAVFS